MSNEVTGESVPTNGEDRRSKNNQGVQGDTGATLFPGATQSLEGVDLTAALGCVEQPEIESDEARTAEAEVQKLVSVRAAWLAAGLPYLIIGLALLAAFESKIFRLIEGTSGLHIERPLLRILVLWFLAIAVVTPFYHFSIQSRINRAKLRLREIEEALEVSRLATVKGRISFYRERLFRLTARTARTFFFDPDRYEEAATLRTKAGNALDAVVTAVSTTGLSDVETYLNALDELIYREEREQKEQRYWQYAAVFVMFLYIAGLVVAVTSTDAAKSNTPTPIFGVPLSVLLWGAAGSLAAILYRFYTEQGRIRFASEFRWLIARPMIGIIMGAVVYLALISGLVLLGTVNNAPAQPTDGALQVGRIEVYWVVAFLAGFSDKFYLGVIDLLVARTVKSEEIKANKIITEKERIPEPHPENSDSQ